MRSLFSKRRTFMKILKRALCVFLTMLFFSVYAIPPSRAGNTKNQPAFSDLPASGWAREAILKACGHGLMNGVGGGRFGTGNVITRAEFVTVLVRMLGWATEEASDAFSDISSSWARKYINTACNKGAVTRGGKFRPDDSITREEMCIMLVKALGYDTLAQNAGNYTLPFTDITGNRGYISFAYDVGMTTGSSNTSFSPKAFATREQAAAMLVRVYEKYISKLSFTHAFYAISSYSQLELAKTFDAVSLGWSRMEMGNGVPVLNTTAKGGNEYHIPESYENAVKALMAAGVKLHLSVFMTTSEGLTNLLEHPQSRNTAVKAIIDELSRVYPELGSNPYSGVTIDFEGLRAPQKNNFTAFLTELSSQLKTHDMTLYTAVSPATSDGAYYDGYDYRAIGGLSDKVILMAHDYAATDMTGFLGSTYYKTSALTPISSVHYSLRAACDKTTGVEDVSKLVLAFSFSSLAWETDERGLLTNAKPLSPSIDTIHKRLTSGAERGWSQTYLNPYLTYVTETGQHIFLWYEDERSIEAKLTLAKLFGITGVSLWRLGLIPSYPDNGIFYNVPDAVGLCPNPPGALPRDPTAF